MIVEIFNLYMEAGLSDPSLVHPQTIQKLKMSLELHLQVDSLILRGNGVGVVAKEKVTFVVREVFGVKLVEVGLALAHLCLANIIRNKC